MLSNSVIFIFTLILLIGSATDASRAKRAIENPETLVSSTALSLSLECKADVQKYCNKGIARSINNLKVLQCVDDLDNAANLISKECQNRIYKYKYNMTHDVRFDDAAMKYCAKDIKLLEDCNDHTDERGTGRLVSCLYDQLKNITESSCRNFINQVQSVIFTDWRLSEYFATTCLKDISDLQCGRLDDDKDTLPHDQGRVIACLSKKQNSLSKPCQKHIFRLHEMQSNDYHLDRALYYACRDDRERFCSQVASGNGRIYRCLYENKFNTMMSSDCRGEIDRRQKIVAKNALLDAPLMRACNSEMLEHKCVANPQDPDTQLSLVNLLLCLEDRIKKGNHINDECRREILIHRRMLMSDYAVSPEVISKCKAEMNQHCPTLYQKNGAGTIDQRGGRMIHCLLGAARKEKTFSTDCLATIKALVRAVDPGSDIRADPLLETACRSVIDTLCARVKPGESNVIICLMDNLKNPRMTEECEDRLVEVGYFMARDWVLTPKLAISCQKNLIDLCELPADWSLTNNMSDINLGQYLSCLYRHKNQLTTTCRSEFQRIMRIRTTAIGLMPEIEDNCIEDLAACKNTDVKGEELKCLQKKYKNLEEQCKTAVRTYTKMTISDPSFNFLLMKTCEPMIQLFCTSIANDHESELLGCLIKNKNNQRMDYRCKVNIEHHQIISLKDEAFISEQFRAKCTVELTEHCAGRKTKASTIQCLADIVLQDVLRKQNRINDQCRNELKFELLQRSENINFDPQLANACKNDIRKFCADRNPGNAQVIDCLKANHNKVSAACFAKLKKREKIDVVLPGADYSLTTKCAPVIQKYCVNENKQNILSCLRRNINQDNTPTACRTVLYNRLMVLNSDGRFNKALIENCQTDIDKLCRNEIIDNDDDKESDDEDGDDKDDDNKNGANDDEVTDRDMGGRIIGCLRSKYADSQVELEPKCVSELVDVIQTSKLNIELDVRLYQSCKSIVNTECLGSEKEDCLKVLYQKNKITDTNCKQQIQRVIKEGRADIHVDPALSAACQVDILKYCNDVPIGGGKQLKCLLRMSKSVTPYCQSILSQRKQLWESISHVEDLDDLARQITSSENNTYFYAVIILVLFGLFIFGCCCRNCLRSRPARKYK